MPPSDTMQMMRSAAEHQRAGRNSDAAVICRKILEAQPRHAQALWLLGTIARQDGRPDEAAEMLQRWLAINPNEAEPHGMLGDIYRAQGKFDEAIRQYREVIRLKPALAAGYLNLGRALKAQRKLAEAITAAQKAVQLRSDWAAAHEFLGESHLENRQYDQAIAAYNQALCLQPDLVAAHWGLGKIFIVQGRDQEALASYLRAVQIDPKNPVAHFFLACRLKKVNRIEEAKAEFREALRLKPDSPVWKYQLAAIAGDGSVKTAPPQYVQFLFDSYAPQFEKHLVEKLDYHIPSLLRERVLEALPRRDLDVLDLGCGTGLCGVEFRPIAQRLVGVDIAPQMIKIAQARNVYDELHTGDLAPVLNAAPNQFDLIVAADVLVYVGDLGDFLPAVARALKSRGIFACSLEDYPGEGFILHPEERYAHSIGYFRKLAADCGLTEVSATQVDIRKNHGVPVAGWNVLVSKG